MTSASSRFSRRLAIAGLGLALAWPATAQQRPKLLEGPRAAGQVGERFDGYAVVRGTQPADVQALVERVNAHRRTHYEEKAAAQNVSIDAIGRIYAAEIIRRVPAGTWLLLEDGKWVQK